MPGGADNPSAQQALTAWLQQRTPAWQELEYLLQTRDAKSADLQQARELVTGFRAPTNLLLRWRDIHAFESPALIRQMSRLLLYTITLFLGAILCGWSLIATFPDLTPPFASSDMIDRVQGGELWTDGLLNIMPSSLLSLSPITNNVTVSIFAFCLGALYGLGTLYIIGLNGPMLGGVFAFTTQYGLDDELFSVVIAHGVVKFSVICIAGAMGLRLGEALLRPATLTRQQAFRNATADAGRVLLVALPFLERRA